MDAAVDTSTHPEDNTRAGAREARAERYFERDLAGQRRWYGERASRVKARAQALGMAIVAAGAATTFFQVFGGAPWVSVLTALLGAVVALAEGWRQIARYDEVWAAYRLASERMKRERRLYVNGAGEYRSLADEEEAYLRFVEAIEAAVAEEQRLYWAGHGGGRAGDSTRDARESARASGGGGADPDDGVGSRGRP